VRAYFDSSVLVAGLMDIHPEYERARAWFERVARREVRGVTSAHGLAETWSALTGIPLRPPLAAATAHRIVREGILARFEIASATARDYERVLASAADLDARGGSVYDALHAAMARKARADVVLTLDIRDFRRVAPDLGTRLRTP
jgi:predicted nucleic acid-binding protein